MAKKQVPKIKAVRAWADVCENKLHFWSGEQPYYEIYRTKAHAALHYEKFVPVLIVPRNAR